MAKGCHDLIKQGAKLVDSAQDILEEMKDLPSPSLTLEHRSTRRITRMAGGTNELANSTTTSSMGIKAHLGHVPVGLDELQRRSGLPTSQLQAQLFQLELAGTLGRLPGGLYQQLTKK